MQPGVGTCVGLTWFAEVGSLIFKTFSLFIRLATLASAAIDDSMEWRSPFEDMGLLFLDLSEVSSIGWSSPLNPEIIITLDFHPFTRSPWHMVSKKVLV